MRHPFIICLFLLSFIACQNEPKNDTSLDKQSPNGMTEQQITRNDDGQAQIDLNNPDVQAAIREKMSKLKPNANNKSSEPILIKGVNLNPVVNQQMVLKGQQVYETKCARCHNMNDKKFNASGFAGITDRKSPAFVMNMVTGVPLNEFAPSNEIATLEKCWTREKANWLDIIEARDFVELLMSQKTQ